MVSPANIFCAFLTIFDRSITIERVASATVAAAVATPITILRFSSSTSTVSANFFSKID